MLAANTTDILETQFACFRLGAIFTPVNIRLTVHELAFIVGDASPVVLVHDVDFAGMAADLQKQCGVSASAAVRRGLRKGDRRLSAARPSRSRVAR